MGILSWILMGLVVGLIARLLMPGKDKMGIIITILLGVAGAFLGGWIGSMLGLGSFAGFDIKSLLLATGGAILILLLFRVLRNK